jgi:predicted DsbA family dithiol-disulfide isomerase
MAIADPLRITIFSDVICPWCFIGTKRLQAALVETEVHA